VYYFWNLSCLNSEQHLKLTWSKVWLKETTNLWAGFASEFAKVISHPFPSSLILFSSAINFVACSSAFSIVYWCHRGLDVKLPILGRNFFKPAIRKQHGKHYFTLSLDVSSLLDLLFNHSLMPLHLLMEISSSDVKIGLNIWSYLLMLMFWILWFFYQFNQKSSSFINGDLKLGRENWS